MSFQAMAWASEQRTGSATRKAVLYSLANHANKHGYCSLRVETICEESELGPTAVKQALRDLAKPKDDPELRPLVERTRQRYANGSLGCYEFRLLLETPHDPLESFPDLRPESLNGPRPETPGVPQEPVRPSEPVRPNPPTVPPRMKVDGKFASEEEHAMALEVLGAFNDVFGTRFKAREFVAKVVMRVREHPALSVEEHRAAIERSFLAPWWSDAPSPSVVYGNAGLFEKALMAVGTPANGNGRPNMKYGQRAVNGAEVDALIERLEAEERSEGRKALASG